MKTPRVTDFDPDAKVPSLKSPLYEFRLNIVHLDATLQKLNHELGGGAAHAQSYSLH
jgi:hypothetical protein